MELENMPSKNAISHLETIPKGQHSLYRRIINSALGRETAQAYEIRLILSLVSVSLRPFTLLELSEVCQLYPEEDDAETRIQFTREFV